MKRGSIPENNKDNSNKEKINYFVTSPEKASARVTINSFMMGTLFFILTLIWSIGPNRFSFFAIVQLILAIPLLYVSSLAYAKVGYWKEIKLWNNLGWYTNHFGNTFLINVAGILAATFSRNLALVYFALFLFLMLIYSVINLIYKPSSIWEKTYKYLLLLITIIIGGVIPIFLT